MKAASNVLNAYQANAVTHVRWIVMPGVKTIFVILIQINVLLVAVKIGFTLIGTLGSVLGVEVPAIAAAVLMRATHVYQLKTGVHIASTVVIPTVSLGVTKKTDAPDVRLDSIDSMIIAKGDIFVRDVQSAAHLVILLRHVMFANRCLLTAIHIISANVK